MIIGVTRETRTSDCRVALTPPVVRHLVESGNSVWVEKDAGAGARFSDDDYLRAGAQIAYSPGEVIRRARLLVKIAVPTVEELDLCPEGAAILAFYHMAVADRAVFEKLLDRKITAIGLEIVQDDRGRRPVLAAVSEIAGQMTVQLAAHLLRSSSGGRGILLGGSPAVPPAHIVILGAGVVGSAAARSAVAAGARVSVLDVDTEKLRRLLQHTPGLATAYADPEMVARAVMSADVAIGAVLVVGAKTPHVVTRKMVDAMQPGAVVIDVAIDQGGCFETSRPTTITDPTFVYNRVLHYAVPNLTADMGRSTSIAVAQALLPYLRCIAKEGVAGALRACPELARGAYTHSGACVLPSLAGTWRVPRRELSELLEDETDTPS
jgi:alanine dehydrogenase